MVADCDAILWAIQQEMNRKQFKPETTSVENLVFFNLLYSGRVV